MSAVGLCAQTKTRIKIKALNTELWWQREDNGQREREKKDSEVARVDCHSATESIFIAGALILYIQLCPAGQHHRFTVHKCTAVIKFTTQL